MHRFPCHRRSAPALALPPWGPSCCSPATSACTISRPSTRRSAPANRSSRSSCSIRRCWPAAPTGIDSCLASLADLDRSLSRLGSRLHVREGDPVARVLDLVSDAGAHAVHMSGDVSRYAHRREHALSERLAAHAVDLHVHPGVTVVEPGEVAPPGKDMYSVFTPVLQGVVAGSPTRRACRRPRAVASPPDLDHGAEARPRDGASGLDRPAAGRRDRRAPAPRGLSSPTASPSTDGAATTSRPTRPRACRRTCGSGA